MCQLCTPENCAVSARHESETGVRDHDGKLKRVVDCVDKHTAQCFDAALQRLFNQVVAGAKETIAEVCLPGDTQDACTVRSSAQKPKKLKRVVDCVDKHTAQCFDAALQRLFNQVVAGAKETIAEVCLPGDTQDDFLRHARCNRKVDYDETKCAPAYRRTLELAKTVSQDTRRGQGSQTFLLRLPGVAALSTSSCNGPDLREIIRDVVREEIRKLLPAAASPDSPSIAEVVRAEVQQALQPKFLSSPLPNHRR
ncbi:hypothetical protein HPB47_025079 [Ixodes persulcatus]|uniref:Uncharacterized protein n=1 Tax=Ixodes persulcatus TaxID=34615 RepID=A0AC60Q2I1_IXOPE|nr:hypothetical protein HPB47_025079 [Ixodes persulcatus]